MNVENVVKDLKQVLPPYKAKNEIDVSKIDSILMPYKGRDYLEVASVAFSNFLETKDLQYKAIFGIAITYARAGGVELEYKDWGNLSSMMKESVTKYNNKHGEKMDWNRLPSDAASMKTMVLAISNRDRMSYVASSLRKGSKILPPVVRVKNFASKAVKEPQR